MPISVWVDFLDASPGAFAVIAALFGLFIGSFLNVVIHRLPIMLESDWQAQCDELAGREAVSATEPYNLVVPRSRCPHCGKLITALQNIPIFSYLFLAGKCGGCGAPISIRYPVVEGLTAVLTAALAWHFGFGLAAAGAMVLAWSLIALTFIDLDRLLLPDSITLPVLWLGLGCNLFHLYVDLQSAVIGAVAGYLVLWLVFHGFRLVTGKEGMGYGDFKLTALLGAWLGWQALPAIILLSSLVGAVVGIILIVWGGHERSQPIPFGPYLAAAGLLFLLWGPQLTQAYLGLVGLA